MKLVIVDLHIEHVITPLMLINFLKFVWEAAGETPDIPQDYFEELQCFICFAA